jgi:hypothetical protein
MTRIGLGDDIGTLPAMNVHATGANLLPAYFRLASLSVRIQAVGGRHARAARQGETT